jgi:biopolymer transport protein ExbD
MPNADRWDALSVAVARDGNVYFGTDKLPPEQWTPWIRDRLRDRSVERKIYLRADARAKYGAVKGVLDAIHSAGIEQVAFLVDERQPEGLGH